MPKVATTRQSFLTRWAPYTYTALNHASNVIQRGYRHYKDNREIYNKAAKMVKKSLKRSRSSGLSRVNSDELRITKANISEERSLHLVTLRGSGYDSKLLKRAYTQCNFITDTTVVYPDYATNNGLGPVTALNPGVLLNGVIGGPSAGFTGRWAVRQFCILPNNVSWTNTASEIYPMGLMDPLVVFTARDTASFVQKSMGDLVGNTSSNGQLTSQMPMNEYFLDYRYTFHVLNPELYGQHVEIYVFVPKLVFGIAAANNPITDLATAFSYQGSRINSTVAREDQSLLSSSLTKNLKYFYERWSLIKVKKIFLEPGADINIKSSVKRSLIKFNVLNEFAYTKGVSHYVYIRSRGQWAHDTTNLKYTTAMGSLVVNQTHVARIMGMPAAIIDKSLQEQAIYTNDGLHSTVRVMDALTDVALTAEALGVPNGI